MIPGAHFTSSLGRNCFSPLLAVLVMIAGVVHTQADEYGFESSPVLKVGTHVRFAQPRVMVGVSGEGGVGYDNPGQGLPGVEVAYGRFGFSASGEFFRDPADNLFFVNRSARNGVQDFRARYYSESWGVESHHLQAQGFNAGGGSREETAALHRSDIRIRAAGVTVYRSFDPESKVYRLSEGLSETGGHVGVFFTAGASYAGIEGDSALVPGATDRQSRFYRVERASVTSASVGGGFALTSNLHGVYFDQSLFAGYGPQYRTWGDRSDVAWNLAKVNLRVALGIRNRWFDLGVGFENEAYASFANSDRMVVNALAMQAKVGVFW